MLVFCEDCGKRHAVREGGDENGILRFRCDVCGFLITATDVPPKERKASAPDPSVKLTCSFEELDLGCALGDAEPEQNIFLAAEDGRKLELDASVLSDVKGNVVVTQLSANVFKVQVTSASKMGADLLNGYDGPCVEFFDSISGALFTLPVIFTRVKQSFSLNPPSVYLGQIDADVLVEGSFVIENSTSAPLAVTVAPDPKCFSLTSFFALGSDSSLIMAGGEKRKISFSVRLSGDMNASTQYEQIVFVKASDNEERPPQKVKIYASLKSPAAA